jgi:lysophospholipase L1-like esterase
MRNREVLAMSRRHKAHRLVWAALVAGVVFAAACSDDSLLAPTPIDQLFARYASIGNSITAGLQSGGINDSTQMESYALLLAYQMGLDTNSFKLPLLAIPGCPAPLTNVYTQERLFGIDIDTLPCALRTPATFDVFSFNNVAVPQAGVRDVLTNLDVARSNPNTLTSIILGGRTQLGAAVSLQPTFVSIMIGNNEVLGAALSGDASQVTPTNDFDTDYGLIVDSLLAAGVQGGVLVGVFNVTAIPYLSAGGVYAALQAGAQLPPAPFLNLPNCGTGGATSLIPFAYGFPKIDSAAAGASVTIDCLNDAEVLDPTEAGTIVQAVADYNTTISSKAQQAGWAYWDPNPTMDSLRALGEIPLFPTPPPAPESVTEPFGQWFSLDGLHPNAQAHELITDKLIEAINGQYGTEIPSLP